MDIVSNQEIAHFRMKHRRLPRFEILLLSLQSPSSSPFIGVNVRPRVSPPSDGFKTIYTLPPLAWNTVSRRTQAFNSSVPLYSPFVSRFTLKMDDLSHTLTATRNLTELKTHFHSFSETLDHPEDDEREEPSAFLAVKLLTNRHFNSEAFKKRLRQIWPERFSINVLEKDPNFYTVEFGCFGNRRRVLIGQPWHFDYKLIVMTPLEAGSVVTAEMLTSTPLWIQVFLKRSRALAQRLGEVLGGLGALTYMSALNSMIVEPARCTGRRSIQSHHVSTFSLLMVWRARAETCPVGATALPSEVDKDPLPVPDSRTTQPGTSSKNIITKLISAMFSKYYFKIDIKKRFAGKPQLYNPYNVSVG
ncbi:hypothetical protein F8388_021206 [Cannabis sativa]|uniref:DUF4283 domain-containing protein n=1 Tax=Cannabis sativa TaxID=3483 RepID=A0A7J6GFG0_CANSA|nr:hypothetical protein F8388_021206 [Cannabis sativa]